MAKDELDRLAQPVNVTVDTNVRAFFHERIHDAATNQHVDATDAALWYLVNLLTSYTQSRVFFDATSDGLTLKPLAGLYAEAVAADNADERNQRLKRLGDLALFVSGVFADSLNRKPVDVDYYIAMGGSAYSYLSDAGRDGGAHWQACGDVFDELSGKFAAFVDLLDEASENAHFRNHGDILRLYEIWTRTGSARAAERLRRLGLEPASGSASLCQH